MNDTTAIGQLELLAKLIENDNYGGQYIEAIGVAVDHMKSAQVSESVAPRPDVPFQPRTDIRTRNYPVYMRLGDEEIVVGTNQVTFGVDFYLTDSRGLT